MNSHVESFSGSEQESERPPVFVDVFAKVRSCQFSGAPAAAPLYYANFGQADAQIPWELAGLTQTMVVGSINGGPNGTGEVGQLGRELFTKYLYAFEATAGLLVIAVVGAVVLARRPPIDELAPERDPLDEEVSS